MDENLPIIIVSGTGNISDTVEALRLGGWDYIIKPIQDMNVLFHAVNKAFERKHFIEEKTRYQKDLEQANRELKISLETQEFLKLYKAGELKRSELENYLTTVEEVSNSILINMERAAELISSFKQVAVDQSSENRRRFNLKEYMDEILLSLRPRYKKTSHLIQVNCDPDIELNSFPGAFSQILSNLIMNSLIHGFTGLENRKIDLESHIGDGVKLTMTFPEQWDDN